VAPRALDHERTRERAGRVELDERVGAQLGEQRRLRPAREELVAEGQRLARAVFLDQAPRTPHVHAGVVHAELVQALLDRYGELPRDLGRQVRVARQGQVARVQVRGQSARVGGLGRGERDVRPPAQLGQHLREHLLEGPRAELRGRCRTDVVGGTGRPRRRLPVPARFLASECPAGGIQQAHDERRVLGELEADQHGVPGPGRARRTHERAELLLLLGGRLAPGRERRHAVPSSLEGVR
jgi:hypothetical protein